LWFEAAPEGRVPMPGASCLSVLQSVSSKPKSHILRALSNEKIKRGNGFINELGGVGKTVISGWGAVQ